MNVPVKNSVVLRCLITYENILFNKKTKLSKSIYCMVPTQ